MLADEEGLAAVGSLEHDIAVAPKDGASESAYLVVVLDEQDRLVSSARLGRRPLGRVSNRPPGFRFAEADRKPHATRGLEAL